MIAITGQNNRLPSEIKAKFDELKILFCGKTSLRLRTQEYQERFSS
ncbi:hypothetical protein NBRC111894_3537 [Sporolactobacillus inulinus]|uniref:Uncharacterized protein n=1 Tax=Sporolactobacillus inulinus TaxID=2078 RepID=A0A4Y1ZG72_9BACL|nr:hypothetical protein NBRC111894_3537 [Sporolactobacillus inulinus]